MGHGFVKSLAEEPSPFLGRCGYSRFSGRTRGIASALPGLLACKEVRTRGKPK